MKLPAELLSLSKNGEYLVGKRTTVVDGMVHQVKMFVSKEDEPEAFQAILDAQKS